jgi:regulatory protein
VAPEHVAAAVGEQDHEDELEAALALLRRRVPSVPQTPRERDRALGMLVRKGYQLELAYDALRRYAGVDAPLD